jgi:predicted neutral ceramidase superfamily lipid hydrolase
MQLDYAPPAVPQRSRISAGIIAYLFACYTVGMTATAIGFAVGRYHFTWVMLIVVVLFPMMILPAILITAIRGNPFSVLWAVAFVALFVLAFRHLRRPKRG